MYSQTITYINFQKIKLFHCTTMGQAFVPS